MEAGHRSDHRSRYSILNIAPPVYTSQRLFSKCNWSFLSDIIKRNPTPAPGHPYLPAQTLAFSTFDQELLNTAIDKSKPWSSPGKRSDPWWNLQLSILRRNLAWAECLARHTPVPPVAAETLFTLRQSRFLFWDQKTRHKIRAAA